MKTHDKWIAAIGMVIVSMSCAIWPEQEREIRTVVLHTQDITGVGTLSDLRGPVEYRVYTDQGMFTTSAEIYEDIISGPMVLKVKGHEILERYIMKGVEIAVVAIIAVVLFAGIVAIKILRLCMSKSAFQGPSSVNDTYSAWGYALYCVHPG